MNGGKDTKLRVFEGNMHAALHSWQVGGGQASEETAIVEMPFEELMRKEERDSATLARIQAAYTRWQELQILAGDVHAKADATRAQKAAAQRVADEWYEQHQGDFNLLETLQSDSEVNDYDWRQRSLGARLVFRWILAEGFHPLKVMKRLYAVGRALDIAPFTQLTMEEQGKMFSETKAAVSWRLKLLSGVIRLRGMMGTRLPGQKSPACTPSYSAAQQGNRNRANGKKRPRQASFLRTLHVPPTQSHK